MPFRSPYPDAVIPDVPLTDYVLGAADDHRDRPALVDGVSGRTITFGELAEARAGWPRAFAALASAKATSWPSGRRTRRSLRSCSMPSSRLGAIVTTANPADTARSSPSS